MLLSRPVLVFVNLFFKKDYDEGLLMISFYFYNSNDTTMKKLLLVLLMFASFLTHSNAQVVGSEITYACTTTPGIFEVTLVVYRNCNSLPLCSGGCGTSCTMSLNVMGADSGFTTQTFSTVTLSLQNVRDADQRDGCPSAKNGCTNMGCVAAGTYTPSVERYEFKGNANIGPTSAIPANCCNVRFVFSICCRSNDIVTGPAAAQTYNHAIVNRCLSVSPCNASPIFKRDPIVTAPGGNNFVYNNAAIDPDGDSISYQFAPVLTDFNTSASYTAPFAFDRPMPWTGSSTGIYPQGIHIDPFNGDIMFTPPNGGGVFKGAMVVEIKQWQKVSGLPTVVGITRRDMELVILGSVPPNNPPRLITNPPLDGNANVAKTNWAICEGEPLCFTITAKDTDFNPPAVSDTTYLGWDSALASLGATFGPDYNPANRYKPDSLGGGPREDCYQFCWTPAIGTGRATPYYFTVTARDNRCPDAGRMSRAISILVSPKASAQIIQTASTCNKVNLSYVNQNPSVPIISAGWRIGKVPGDSLFSNGFDFYAAGTSPTLYTFKNTGRYYIQLVATTAGPIGATACTKEYKSYIDAIGSTLRDSISFVSPTCYGIPDGSITLNGHSGSVPYQYKLDTQTSYASNNIFNNLKAGTHIAWVKDINDCIVLDTIVLTQPVEMTVTKVVTAPICQNGSSGKLTIGVNGGLIPYRYQLDQQPFQLDSFFNNLAPGQYNLVVKDDRGCFKNDSFTISNPEPIKSTLLSLNMVCSNDSDASIKVVSNSGTPPFLYKLNNGAYQFSNIYTGLGPGKYYVTTKDSNACTTIDSVEFHNPHPTTLGYTLIGPSCFGGDNGRVVIQAANGTAPYTYSLNHGTPQSNPEFSGLRAQKYAMTVSDSNHCIRTDSFTVTEPEALVLTTHQTNISCHDEQNGELTYEVHGGTTPYTSYFDSVIYTPPVTISHIGPGVHVINIRDLNGCTKTSRDTFTNPPPIYTGSIMGDSIAHVNSIHTYAVNPQANLSYHWTVNGGTILSGENGSNVSIRWDSTGIWELHLRISDSSCMMTLTQKVNIGSVGLIELSKSWGLKVYPNPAKNILNIQLQQLPENAQIQLYSIVGKLVFEQPLTYTQHLDLALLTPGVYILKIGEWTGQVIKE
jgi:hypothetical protein